MNIASFIDHTLLAPEATSQSYSKLCQEAIDYGFKTVCVPPMWVAFCCEILKNSPTQTCSVVGFPLGYCVSELKGREAELCLAAGADEIDMVMNISFAAEGRWEQVKRDIEVVRARCQGKILKVILETCLLTDNQIVKACETCEAAGADFVKTSTGLSKSGANIHVVSLMKKSVSPRVQVKASGGIRDLASAREMIEAGATRLGTSSGPLLIKGEHLTKDKY